MVNYDVPGITTSVIDYSVITPSLTGGRTPLIIGPSKFGDDTEIMEINSIENLKYLTGGPNYQKFGLGLNYAYGALTVTGKILFKRLIASDATYANIGINNENNNISVTSYDTTDKLKFYSTGLINHFGKNKGEGYNEFFITYTPDLATEKIYANDEGDSNYKYNFLKLSIYQKLPEGIKTIVNNISVSLIDIDPITNTPIVDIVTGETLYINDRIENKNDFIDIKINETYLNDLKKYLNISDINKEKGTPEVILKDINTGINYKVKTDSSNEIYLEATSVTGNDQLILKYYSNGAWNYEKIWVENGEFKKDSTTDVDPNTSTYEKLYTVGDSNFVYMYIDSDTQELVIKEFKTLRTDLYKKLLNSNWQLESGFDGKNVHINDIINFNGPSEKGSENIKTLMLDFLNSNLDIREVMFPKYIFNYVVDWTCDLDVINSIINLTDSIGRALGLQSLPLSYNYEEDYKLRTEKLYQSTYNNIIYPGEWNLKHYDLFAGKNISMPMSYYMMIAHLKIDNTLSITEPVAGIVKGQIPYSNLQLTYTPKTPEIEKLRHVQLNCIIKETDGIYAIDQLTMYKKASKLSRINVVKVIHQMRIDLPQLLKEFIQTKEVNNNVDHIQSIVNNYMNKWAVTTNGNNPDEIFKSININTLFIPEEYKLVVSIRVVPIGTIEKIDIPIIVENQS